MNCTLLNSTPAEESGFACTMVNFDSLQFETAISDGSMQQSIGHFCQSILERGLTPSQIIDAAREGDIDGNGTLDLREFMDVCWLKLRLRLDSRYTTKLTAGLSAGLSALGWYSNYRAGSSNYLADSSNYQTREADNSTTSLVLPGW